ncbi:hypothetical protein QQG55_27795 [Brugia pahangi]
MHFADICTCTQCAITSALCVYSHIPTYATYTCTHTHADASTMRLHRLIDRMRDGTPPLAHTHTQGAQTAVEFELPPRAATRDMYLHWVQCVASLYDMRELASRACPVVITCHFRVLWGSMA